VQQYARHFLPGFLFVHGDANLLQSPPGGELLWAELPVLLLGLFFMARRRDSWDRLSLVWLLLYPIASAITLGDRPDYVPHSLRAAVGLPLFQFIGGDGIATALASISRRRGGATQVSGQSAGGSGTTPEAGQLTSSRRRSGRGAVLATTFWAIAIAANLTIVAIVFTGSYAREVAPRYHAAYPPAVRYLAANRGSYSALLISGRGVQQAYIYSILYGLQTPRSFREGPKEITETGFFHVVHRTGEIYYFYSPDDLLRIRSHVRGRVWTLAAPGEIRTGSIVGSFPYAGGEPGLEVREIEL
jgi:hypothetical protein